MAASSRVIRVIEITNNLPVYKNYDSKSLELLLKTLSVTSDNGTTVLTISESSGAFAFGNKVLGGVSQPVVAGDVVSTSTGNTIAAGLLPDLSGAYIATSQKSAASGVCPLDANTLVPAAYLPSYVDDVLEYANVAAFPTVGAAATVTYDTVVFTAVNRGVAGNSIALVFNGTDTVQDVVTAWNTANASNTVGFTGQAGSYQPAAGTATLSGGVNVLAEVGKIYIAIDTSKSWRFTGTIYSEIIASPGTTDAITEGSVNLFFHESNVRATVLTGLSSASGGILAEADSILTAFGKLENRVNLNDAKVSYSASTARTDLIASSISDGDTTHAPDGESVFTALAGKSDTGHDHSGVYSPVGHDHSGVYAPATHSHVSGDITSFATDVKAAAVVNSTAGTENDQAASVSAMKSYISTQLGSTISAAFANKEGGSVAHTIRQLTFLDTAAGGMKKALATNAALSPSVLLGMVRDASIADQASGQYYLPRKGTVVDGFTGLTVGPVYLSRATAGGTAYDLTGFITNDHVILVGWAISATEILWVGEYQYMIG